MTVEILVLDVNGNAGSDDIGNADLLSNESGSFSAALLTSYTLIGDHRLLRVVDTLLLHRPPPCKANDWPLQAAKKDSEATHRLFRVEDTTSSTTQSSR